MKFSKEKLLNILPNGKLNASGKEITIDCPYCYYRECGIAINKDNHPFQCFRKKNCGVTTNIYGILRQLGKEDLLEGKEKTLNVFNNLENNIINNENKKETQLFDDKKVEKPIGFYYKNNDWYLEKRGFVEKDFYYFLVGETDIWPKYKNYILFLIYEKELLKGFVGRHKYNGVPKYINSQEFDGEKLLYNFDSINENTNIVILVEGIMDVVNITKLLNYDDEVVCCGTFGAKVSNTQIKKIMYKGVQNIILLYDPDVIRKIKEYSYKLLQKFNTYVGDLGKVDPGELTYKQFCYVLDGLYDPFEYFISKVDKKIITN